MENKKIIKILTTRSNRRTKKKYTYNVTPHVTAKEGESFVRHHGIRHGATYSAFTFPKINNIFAQRKAGIMNIQLSRRINYPGLEYIKLIEVSETETLVCGLIFESSCKYSPTFRIYKKDPNLSK